MIDKQSVIIRKILIKIMTSQKALNTKKEVSTSLKYINSVLDRGGYG